MGDTINFDYYYGIEAEQFSFYRVPRLLIKDERFKGLAQKLRQNVRKADPTLVAKGEYSMQEFMDGIADMVKNLVQTYHSISDEQKSMFGGNQSAQEALGKCPKCGGDVVKGKYGAYCKSKCGMNVGKAMGTVLSDTQIKSMLEGKKTFVKGLKGKKGTYDAYLIPEGIEDYSYTKDGKEIKGSQYKVKLEFAKRSK